MESNGDMSLVLYAADTQNPDDDNEISANSDISLVLASDKSPVQNRPDPIICPDSPVSPILDLSAGPPCDGKEMQAGPSKTGGAGNAVSETPTTSVKRETKQFGLLTEYNCKGDISISEEKLGFSLPENMANLLQEPRPNSDSQATTIGNLDGNDDDDDDFKISSTSKPSSSNSTSTNNVSTL